MNAVEGIRETQQPPQQSQLFHQNSKNFQYDSLDIFNSATSNSAKSQSSNNSESQQLNQISNPNDQLLQKVPNEGIHQDIQQQIKELKSMAIILKQKLYEENKSDFDKSIIEYTQQQKKLYQEKSEFDKVAYIQKTFSFNKQLEKTPSNIACPKELHQNLEQIVEDPSKIQNSFQQSPQQQELQNVGNSAQPQEQANPESQSSDEVSSEEGDSPDDMQIERLTSQNLLLENQNKRLTERIDQLNTTIEKQLEEFNVAKIKSEALQNMLSICCFAQQHIYQIVQSAQVQIDSSSGNTGLITIQGNKIIIYDDITTEIKPNLEKSFSIYDLYSVDYQKVTMKLNFDKAISLKIQFKNQENLRMFDSLVYIQRMKKTITDRKPFFNHPELPKAEGVIGRVVKFQQNKSFSPQRNQYYNPDLNTSISDQQNQSNNNMLLSTYCKSSNEVAADEAFKLISQSQQLTSQRGKRDNSPNENIQLFKDNKSQLNNSQQLVYKKFNQRRSLIVEKGKEFFSFLKPNKIHSTEQFDDTSVNNNLNNTNQLIIKEASILENNEINKTQLPTQNISILNDSVLNKSVLSVKQKKPKQIVKTDEELHEEALSFLRQGVNMKKYSKDGIKPREKRIQMNEKEDQLTWCPPNKQEKNPKHILLKDIVQIMQGRDSPGFAKHKKLDNPSAAERSFYIICANGRRLELEASDKNQRNTFIRHLQCHLHIECKKTYQQKPLFQDAIDIKSEQFE